MRSKVSTVNNQISDHDIIISEIKYKHKPDNRQTQSITWKEINYKKVKEYLSQNGQQPNPTSLDEKYEELIKRIQQAIEINIKTRKSTRKRQLPNTEWASEKLIKFIADAI